MGVTCCRVQRGLQDDCLHVFIGWYLDTLQWRMLSSCAMCGLTSKNVEIRLSYCWFCLLERVVFAVIHSVRKYPLWHWVVIHMCRLGCYPFSCCRRSAGCTPYVALWRQSLMESWGMHAIELLSCNPGEINRSLASSQHFSKSIYTLCRNFFIRKVSEHQPMNTWQQLAWSPSSAVLGIIVQHHCRV